MSRRQLTAKQHAFLEFLQGHLADHHVWPTYREIVDHFEYRSPNSVTQNLQALSRKGFLERDRNGYRLVDHSGRDGTIAVRGTLRRGGVAPSESAERLSLATLFADLQGLHALRLGDGVDRRLSDLDEAQYVLVDEGRVDEGDTAVVLAGDAVVLTRVGAGGRVGADDVPGDHVIVGRYAGHAGPYGVVRHGPVAPVLPAPARDETDTRSDSEPDVAALLAAEAQAATVQSVQAVEALALSAPAAEA